MVERRKSKRVRYENGRQVRRFAVEWSCGWRAKTIMASRPSGRGEAAQLAHQHRHRCHRRFHLHLRLRRRLRVRHARDSSHGRARAVLATPSSRG